MATFKKMVKIIIEFGKIRKFILVIIFVIFSQNWQFRLKNKSFKFLEIHPYQNIHGLDQLLIHLVTDSLEKKSNYGP